MNYLYKEKTLLNLIRYGAIILILIFSFVITNIFVSQKKEYMKEEIKKVENSFISHNKIMVENLVNKIHNFIQVEKERASKDLKLRIKEEVYKAHAIATKIYTENIKKDNYSKEETINQIKEVLRTISFNNGNGYIFIDGSKGEKVLHKIKDLEGKNLLEFKDAKGYQFVKTIVETIKNKTERFDEYYWYKGTDRTKSFKKVGFYKYFEPYNFAIGSGDYIDDFEKNLQKKVLEKLNSLKFKKPEHIFVYDKEGLCLVNPKKELIGVNRYNAQNKNGRYVLREILHFTLGNKEGFVRYKGAVILNKNNVTNDKISFVKLFEDWQWMIGSGFYLEELYNDIEAKKLSLQASSKKAVEKILIFATISTLIMIVLSFYLSNVFAKIFENYKQKIKRELEKSLEKEKLLIQQSKMATMGEMIGNISHQWKQPLSVMSMANGLLKLNQEEKNFSSEKELNEAVESIENSINYLSTTIDDFRNFFRPDKNKEYFHLEKTLDKTCSLINSQFKNNDIEIIKNVENLELFGFQNELLQVLINILKNAKDELVKLDKNTKRFIFVDIKKENDYISIVIRDNAGGIKPDIINKIFEAYFTTKEDGEGTGIGLYMSKQIIEGMNGTIEVSNVDFEYENNQYKGAEFKILFNINEMDN